MSAIAADHHTLATALWPTRSVPRSLILALAGTVLLAISAKIQIPFWPVPMTMQTFAVLTIAMAYGLRLGTATVALYLAQGAIGLPVFAAGGGLAYFAGPTTGYLAGFLVAAALVGWLGQSGWDRTVPRTLAAMGLGTACIFLLGFAWLSVFLSLNKDLNAVAALAAAWSAGVAPFLVGAAFKIALAAAVLPLAWRLVDRRARRG